MLIFLACFTTTIIELRFWEIIWLVRKIFVLDSSTNPIVPCGKSTQSSLKLGGFSERKKKV